MIENNRLGKGLSSLLGERMNIVNSPVNDGNVKEIIIENIKPNRNQPRRDFDQNSIDELAQSIKEYGILQPVIVRKIDDANFELIAGERRLKACKKLNMKTIPAIIKNFDEEKSFILSVMRPRVAGVYANRLQRNMLLQADPTVIYGLGPSFDGNLRRSHLDDPANPYNTYQRPGLPPGPICSFGVAALAAAITPEKHRYLYFVAKVDGGEHVFSTNLNDHNRAVRQYLRNRRNRR